LSMGLSKMWLSNMQAPLLSLFLCDSFVRKAHLIHQIGKI
jgi:hypothetical protein